MCAGKCLSYIIVDVLSCTPQVASKEQAKAAEAALLAAFDYPWNVSMNGPRRLSAVPPPKAPSSLAAATKRVTAPCLFLLDPVSAVTAVGGAVSGPVGPTVAYLHHPSSTTPLGTPAAHQKPAATREVRSGGTSPLPEWLVSAYGVRQGMPTSPTVRSGPTSPYRGDWDAPGQQAGRAQGREGGGRDAGQEGKSFLERRWGAAEGAAERAADRAAEGAAEGRGGVANGEAKREPWSEYSRGDCTTYNGWADDDERREAEALYGGWLAGGVPEPDQSHNSTKQTATIRSSQNGARSTPAGTATARDERNRGPDLRQRHYSTVAGQEPSAQKVGVLCMAPLRDGGRCQAVPVKGRKRCSEHKGMRVGAL